MDTFLSLLDAWKSRLGDNTFWGWFITVTYGITFVASLKTVMFFHAVQLYGRKKLWILISVTLLFFGLNKQLDLQTLLYIVVRYLFSNGGFHRYPREIILTLSMATLLVISSGAILLLWRARKILHSSCPELSGMLVLISFYVLRAGSLMYISRRLHIISQLIPRIHVLELTGLIIVLYSACRYCLEGRKMPPKG